MIKLLYVEAITFTASAVIADRNCAGILGNINDKQKMKTLIYHLHECMRCPYWVSKHIIS